MSAWKIDNHGDQYLDGCQCAVTINTQDGDFVCFTEPEYAALLANAPLLLEAAEILLKGGSWDYLREAVDKAKARQ